MGLALFLLETLEKSWSKSPQILGDPVIWAQMARCEHHL